jgi:hypothetical protein
MSDLELLLDAAQLAYIEVMNVLSNEQHWEEYQSRGHMLAARRKGVDGLHDIKVEIFFNKNPQLACEYVFEHWVELEHKFGISFEEVNIYRTFEDGSRIVYEREKIKGILPREYYNFITLLEMGNGAWAIMGTAAEIRDLPSSEGYVKGKLNFMLQLYEPVYGNNERCRLLVIEKNDPKGLIPTVFMNNEMDHKAEFYENMIKEVEQHIE